MEQHLKQRILGAVVIVSRVDLDAPLTPRISFDQSFPELRDPKVVSTREQVSVQDLASTARGGAH